MKGKKIIYRKKDTKFYIFVYLTLILFIILSVIAYNLGKEYKDNKTKNEELLEKIKVDKNELKRVSDLKDTNVFELDSIKEENSTKISEYELWEKRNTEMVEKLSK